MRLFCKCEVVCRCFHSSLGNGEFLNNIQSRSARRLSWLHKKIRRVENKSCHLLGYSTVHEGTTFSHDYSQVRLLHVAQDLSGGCRSSSHPLESLPGTCTNKSFSNIACSTTSSLKSSLQRKRIHFCGNILVGKCILNSGSNTCVDSRKRLHTSHHCRTIPHHDVRTRPPWRVLFFGTDQLSVYSLKALYENWKSTDSYVDHMDVVSLKGQTPVRTFAKRENICVIDWPLLTTTDQYDVGVLVSFGKLIPKHVIDMFPYGIINIHPSLLPRWRGASPIIHTILNGDTMTGVSVMDIRPRHFDIGPILMQRQVPVPPRVTNSQLTHLLEPVMADMMLDSLADLPRLERLEHEQNRRGVTYAHKITHRNSWLDWENDTCEDIDRQYRAISDQLELKIKWRGRTGRLLNMVDQDRIEALDLASLKPQITDVSMVAPGMPFFSRKERCIVVRCKDGFVGFRDMKLKLPMCAQSFYNGYLSVARNCWIPFTSERNYLNEYTEMDKIPVQSVQ